MNELEGCSELTASGHAVHVKPAEGVEIVRNGSGVGIWHFVYGAFHFTRPGQVFPTLVAVSREDAVRLTRVIFASEPAAASNAPAAMFARSA